MSPVFNAMHGKILKLSNGTNGDFCIRCHTPVGMNLEEREFMSNIDRHPTSREGITCIVCHRIDRAYGKLSGRLAIAEGDVTAPVYQATDGGETAGGIGARLRQALVAASWYSSTPSAPGAIAPVRAGERAWRH